MGPRLIGVPAALALWLAILAGSSAAAPTGGDNRIVGGSVTTIEQYPYTVALADHPSLGGNGFQRQFCGGTLVAPRVVITAAHCVYIGGGVWDSAGNLSIISGRTKLSTNTGQESNVSDYYYFAQGPGGPVHMRAGSLPPGQKLYDEVTSEWDVVFMVLQTPSNSTPIRIAGATEKSTWAPGTEALITGWGTTSYEGPASDTLKVAQVPITSDAACSAFWGLSATELETILCAGRPAGGQDTCQGDSGGPLVVRLSDSSLRLIGDTSFGPEGCGDPGSPAGYGRVADDTMRNALRAGILAVTGDDVTAGGSGGGGGTADTIPPQTRITRAPFGKTSRRSARIAFRSTEVGSFQCRRNSGRWRSCSSPKRIRSRRGRNVFRARAIDAAGNVDPTPAKARWRYKRRR